MNKPVVMAAAADKKHIGEKTTRGNTPEKTIQREPKTKIAAGTLVKPPDAPQPMRVVETGQRSADYTGAATDTIVFQRWKQNSPGSVFPAAEVIECTTDKNDIVCWTEVLAGKRNSRTYRYKIKMILDKFGADNRFVMTYRNLILSSGATSSNEETGGLGALPERIKPGWEAMINRLPCRLVSHDKIVCSPVGETQFVLQGAEVRTSLVK